MTEFAREYGEGLYALCAQEGLTDEALSELETLKALFDAQPDFMRLLGNLSLSKAERTGMLDAALRGQIHVYVLSFLKILCERGAISEFRDCAAAFRARYNAEHGVEEATVTTSVPLTPEQREALLKKLTGMSGKRIELREKVDASLMGGVLLEMNGQRYDNTVRRRLEEIRRAMTQDA